MGKLYGKILGKVGYIFSLYVILGVICWISSTPAVTYDPIEPVTLLKNASEHLGEFIKFQAKFSHIIYPKTKELLSSTTGAGVNLAKYDSFKVYGKKFSIPRMLMYKRKDNILYQLKQHTPVTIYGQVFKTNMVGEPIILVHKIEKFDDTPVNVGK